MLRVMETTNRTPDPRMFAYRVYHWSSELQCASCGLVSLGQDAEGWIVIEKGAGMRDGERAVVFHCADCAELDLA